MKIASLAMLASLILAGCSATTPPDVLTVFDPADPAMGIRDTRHQGVIIGYTHREPANPQNWRRSGGVQPLSNSGAGS